MAAGSARAGGASEAAGVAGAGARSRVGVPQLEHSLPAVAVAASGSTAAAATSELAVAATEIFFPARA